MARAQGRRRARNARLRAFAPTEPCQGCLTCIPARRAHPRKRPCSCSRSTHALGFPTFGEKPPPSIVLVPLLRRFHFQLQAVIRAGLIKNSFDFSSRNQEATVLGDRLDLARINLPIAPRLRLSEERGKFAGGEGNPLQIRWRQEAAAAGSPATTTPAALVNVRFVPFTKKTAGAMRASRISMECATARREEAEFMGRTIGWLAKSDHRTRPGRPTPKSGVEEAMEVAKLIPIPAKSRRTILPSILCASFAGFY